MIIVGKAQKELYFMKWFNPQCAPFDISGFPFYKQEMVFRRLPLGAEGFVPDAVYGLADETAGGQIRFHGKLKSLTIQVSLAGKPLFFDNTNTAPHLASTNKKAFDLYLSANGKEYIFFNVAKGMCEETSYYTYTFINWEEPQEFDFLLNFPLYGGVDKILIGVDEDAEISAPHHSFCTDKKIAIYGSSIQQGACASRPGMGLSNILSRWMNTEVYNLGFNSSGKAEPEMAEVISQIPDLSALIISIEGNCPDGQWLDEKLRGFLEIFRTRYPQLPIIILPFIVSGLESLVRAQFDKRMQYREIQQKIVVDRKAGGDNNIYLLLQDDALTREFAGHGVWHECTVDALHYTDIGFYWVAQLLYKFLREELGL